MRLWCITLLILSLPFVAVGHEHKQATSKEDFRTYKQAVIENTAGSGCAVCGMDLAHYYKTNTRVVEKDGKSWQYCSLNCLIAAVEVKQFRGKMDNIAAIYVLGLPNLQFINARESFYVIGSSKPATMSKVSYYAFETRQEAQNFAKEFGGEVSDFESAYAKAKSQYTSSARETKKNSH